MCSYVGLLSYVPAHFCFKYKHCLYFFQVYGSILTQKIFKNLCYWITSCSLIKMTVKLLLFHYQIIDWLMLWYRF